jgi:hypothetical protein
MLLVEVSAVKIMLLNTAKICTESIHARWQILAYDQDSAGHTP